MKTMLTIFCCLLLTTARAQEAKPKKALHFQSTLQAGLLEGQEGEALQLQVVNGFYYGPYTAGIGVGLDKYKQRSIPVFLDLRRQLWDQRRSPFAYADGGVNFPWKQKLMDDGRDLRSGLFYELGLGYRFPAGRNAFSFSAGYSFKAYESSTTYTTCPFIGECYQTTNRYNYRLRRLAFKAGFSF